MPRCALALKNASVSVPVANQDHPNSGINNLLLTDQDWVDWCGQGSGLALQYNELVRLRTKLVLNSPADLVQMGAGGPGFLLEGRAVPPDHVPSGTYFADSVVPLVITNEGARERQGDGSLAPAAAAFVIAVWNEPLQLLTGGSAVLSVESCELLSVESCIQNGATVDFGLARAFSCNSAFVAQMQGSVVVGQAPCPSVGTYDMRVTGHVTVRGGGPATFGKFTITGFLHGSGVSAFAALFNPLSPGQFFFGDALNDDPSGCNPQIDLRHDIDVTIPAFAVPIGFPKATDALSLDRITWVAAWNEPQYSGEMFASVSLTTEFIPA